VAPSRFAASTIGIMQTAVAQLDITHAAGAAYVPAVKLTWVRNEGKAVSIIHIACD
jgi:hypothetical protein